MIENGFKQSKNDYSLFTKLDGSTFVAILAYVDDMILTGNDMKAISQAQIFLHKEFKMKDMGDLSYFLEIEVDRTDQGILLSQRKCINDLLTQYAMTICRTLKLPMETHVKLLFTAGSLLSHPEIYQRLNGKLIYITLTRPDIAYIVHVLSQFMHSPTSVHFQAAKKVLRYLAGSQDQGILLASKSGAHLKDFYDSDWAGCPNIRKSTSGFAFFLASLLLPRNLNNNLWWQDQQQRQSTGLWLAMAICEVMWVKEVLKELGLKHLGSTPILCM